MPEGKVSEEHDYRLDRYTDVIESVDWKAAVETGDVLHRLHAHIWLTITHYSQVQINVNTTEAEWVPRATTRPRVRFPGGLRPDRDQRCMSVLPLNPPHPVLTS